MASTRLIDNSTLEAAATAPSVNAERILLNEIRAVATCAGMVPWVLNAAMTPDLADR
jgi:hypothetical protein